MAVGKDYFLVNVSVRVGYCVSSQLGKVVVTCKYVFVGYISVKRNFTLPLYFNEP